MRQSVDMACSRFARLTSATSSPSVTPATMSATASPKRARISSTVTGVSSTVSCSSPATMVSQSMRRSASMHAVAIGWVMNGSPLLRTCPACASAANRSASLIVRSSDRRYDVARCRLRTCLGGVAPGELWSLRGRDDAV
eukprot:5243827-Prymnesium_polylepis.1